MSDIKDPALAPSGEMKIAWAHEHMPVLNSLARQYAPERPFAGVRIAVCCHLEAKTAYLIRVMQELGADVYACASNPLSTQDDVVAALVKGGANVFAVHGEDEALYSKHIEQVLEAKPCLIVDDGGDVVSALHEKHPDLVVWGSSEETTTGILRLKGMQKAGTLKIPAIAVNDAQSKYLFDNRYGTGQSVWDGINRTTNLIVAGKWVVVAGYGWCGKGVAKRAAALGARVIVTEIDPFKAAEAIMDGFSSMTMDDAAHIGDYFVTVTGCDDVITERHFRSMKSGAILANAGHFDCEINVACLEQIAVSHKEVRNNIEQYTLEDGRVLNLLAGGRLVNLAAGDGHPAEIMDLSFSLQLLAQKYLLDNHSNLTPGVHNLPDEIDREVISRKLEAMGGAVDTLTEAQKKYLYG